MRRALIQQVFEEFIYAARQAPRMYFAPLVGAIREVRRVNQEIEKENRARAEHQRAKQLNDRQ
jgi:hypothetical protein